MSTRGEYLIKASIAALTAIPLLLMMPIAVLGQQPQQPSQIYEDTAEGVRIQVPQGYVVEDNEPISLEEQAIFDMVPEFTLPHFLLTVCPEELSKPAIGGGHTCENPPEVTFGPREGSGVIGSAGSVHVMKYTNLLEKAEFEPVVRQGKNITVDDLVIYHSMQLVQGRNIDSEILKTTNTTVNYYPQGITSQPIQLPARWADIAYTIRWVDGGLSGSMDYRGFFLHVLDPNEDAGYVLAYEQPQEEAAKFGQQSWVTPTIGMIFDSFELVGGEG